MELNAVTCVGWRAVKVTVALEESPTAVGLKVGGGAVKAALTGDQNDMTWPSRVATYTCESLTVGVVNFAAVPIAPLHRSLNSPSTGTGS